jgi:hypothetical protein
MSKRFSRQSVMLNSGSVVRGKSVRCCTVFHFADLNGCLPFSFSGGYFIGSVRVDGKEIPVSRFMKRRMWQQAGPGTLYNSKERS